MKAGDDYILPPSDSDFNRMFYQRTSVYITQKAFRFFLKSSDLNQETASLHFIFIQRIKVNTMWQTGCCHPKRCSKP